MFGRTLFDTPVSTICEYLTKQDLNIQDRDKYLSTLLGTANSITHIKNAVTHIQSKLNTNDAKAQAMRPLYKRALTDLACALGQNKPDLRFICRYLCHPERDIVAKDTYLDKLLTLKDGKKFCNQVITRIQQEISSLTMMMLQAIWTNHRDEQYKLEGELRSANYTLDLLKAALDRLAPTTKSLYQYLRNSERSSQQKQSYLEHLANSEHRIVIRLTHDNSKWRMQDLKKLFGNNKFFEVNDAYKHPSHYLSAFDVNQILYQFIKPDLRRYKVNR
jgi:hypothetical protein